jgi:hypothetical protein
MYRLFYKSDQCLRKDLVIYISHFLNFAEALDLCIVNKRLLDIIKESKLIQTYKRLLPKFNNLNYLDLLKDNSFLLDNTLAHDMSFQIKVMTINFDYHDWIELRQVLLFILFLKLRAHKKIELHQFNIENNSKSLYYLTDSLEMIDNHLHNIYILSTKICYKLSNSLFHLIILGRVRICEFVKCKFTKVGFSTVLQILKSPKFNCHNPIRSLNFKRCELGDIRTSKLLLLLENKINLSHLDLTHNNLSERPFSILCTKTKSFYFKSLVLDFNEINSNGSKWLGVYLSYNKDINEISLVNSFSDQVYFNHISESLVKAPNLCKLSIGLNELSENTSLNFLKNLKKNKSLKSLRIFFWEFTYNTLIKFFQYLSNKHCMLEEINFNSLNMSNNDVMFTLLIENLIKNKSVKYLLLINCELEDKNYRLLSKLLKYNHKLTKIDLRENIINDEQLKQLKKLASNRLTQQKVEIIS